MWFHRKLTQLRVPPRSLAQARDDHTVAVRELAAKRAELAEQRRRTVEARQALDDLEQVSHPVCDSFR